jgi:hypothetical protein
MIEEAKLIPYPWSLRKPKTPRFSNRDAASPAGAQTTPLASLGGMPGLMLLAGTPCGRAGL